MEGRGDGAGNMGTLQDGHYMDFQEGKQGIEGGGLGGLLGLEKIEDFDGG